MTTQIISSELITRRKYKKNELPNKKRKRYFPSSFSASCSISSKRVMELSMLYLLADS